MPKINTPLFVPLVIGIIAIITFILVSLTLTSVLIFIPTVGISYIIYLYRFYNSIPAPNKTLPLYLLLVAIQFLHFTEEYLTGFNVKLPALLGQAPYPMEYWIIFNMIAYFVFIMGGIILYKQIKELLIIPIFFILTAVIINSIAHLLLSIYVGGYFPGLITAIIYLCITPLFLYNVLRE